MIALAIAKVLLYFLGIISIYVSIISFICMIQERILWKKWDSGCNIWLAFFLQFLIISISSFYAAYNI